MSIFSAPAYRRRLLGARDACVASLDLSVVLGRRTFNRIVGARAAVRPTVQAPRRVPRIWGHWAHLMTTVHRGRRSDGGFVAQFLRLRKFVTDGTGSVPALFSGLVCIYRDHAFSGPFLRFGEASRLHSCRSSTPNKKSPSNGARSVPALFSGLVYIFTDRAFGRTKMLLIESSRLHSRLPSTPKKKSQRTRQPRSGTYLGPNSPNDPQNLPSWSPRRKIKIQQKKIKKENAHKSRALYRLS